MKAMVSKIASVLLGFSLFFSAAAAAITPTPQQIEQFKQLPVEQQRALAKQYGVDLNALVPSSSAVIPPPIVEKPVVAPREASPKDTVLEQSIAETSSPVTLEEKKEDRVVAQKLDQFGYELFAGSPSTFAPVTNVPVPLEYIVGPGDSIVVQLYGKINTTHDLAVSREGFVQFPEVGPLSVVGLNFEELRKLIQDTVAQKMIGVSASITMGALRSIQVFVLGEAFKPGAYTVSALSTMTNALFVSGGVTKIGSLRNVQLKRKGEIVGTLDLYDLLLEGDTTHDTRLQPGDVIFIPPIGKTVGIKGEVRRPAIYEIKGEKKATEIVALAGGLLPTAYPSETRIDRINTKGERTLVSIDLNKAYGKQFPISDGDVINVFPVLDKIEGVVLLSGHVQRPGAISWRKGMRVADVIGSITDDLLPDPDLNYALIKRETLPARRIKVIQIDLGAAISRTDANNNVELFARDELIVFALSDAKRNELIKPLTARLENQATAIDPPAVVKISGNVRFPGVYPLANAMSARDLIDAAGGLSKEAYSGSAEQRLNYAFLRRERMPNREVEVYSVALSSNSGKFVSIDLSLMSRDELIILNPENRQKQVAPLVQELYEQAVSGRPAKVVSVAGNVKFPGEYPLAENMSAEELLNAAGGFLESAYGIDAEISRSTVNEKQFQQTARIKVNFSNHPEVGAMSAKALLLPRDQLFVKRVPGWEEREYAEIQGEVNFPGRYPIFKGDTIRSLVERAGGLNEHADPSSSIFLRESLRQREQQQIDKYRRKLETDVAKLKVEAAQSKTATSDAEKIGSSLLSEIVSVQAAGRLVVDLKAILEGAPDSDVVLFSGDTLVLPKKSQEVSVIGEVQFPTSHLYKPGSDVFDYINNSGGFTPKSDEKYIYVIAANGQVKPVVKGLFSSKNVGIYPGDTVVVPYDVESMSTMSYWLSVSQIMFQLSTTVAALNAVGAF